MIGTQASNNTASARIGLGQDGVEDVPMQSSPFMSSSLPPEEDPDEVSTSKVVALVKEQDLEGEMCMQDILSTSFPFAMRWTK